MSRKAIMTLLAVMLSFMVAFPVLAGAPEFGNVVEGQSVPGIVALGFTRADIEAAYGPPEDCTDLSYYVEGGPYPRGIDGLCDFDVNGGGQVSVYYEDFDGNPAQGTPDDIVFSIRWTQAVGGWTTTAGVNTTLALDNFEAVADAYPNTEVTNTSLFSTRIRDYELGIQITRSVSIYNNALVSVSMSIFFPGPPPPPREKQLRVVEIDLSIVKRDVKAAVRIRDDLTLPVSGARVEATWTLPDGST